MKGGENMSTMKSAQAVYYGPGSVLYPSAGSVASGEVVTALWKEGTWCYIQYSATIDLAFAE